MSKLTPTLPLNGFAQEWPGLSIKEDYLGELISLACPLNQDAAFATAFKKVFGKAPPKPNEMVEITGGAAMWTGQGQYMLLLTGENIQADLDIAEKLGGTAYATLQSDGWASLDLKGPRIFDVLERFIPLDIRRAPTNFAARTIAHHIAVMVLKISETEIRLLTPRSSAQSFLGGLIHVMENCSN